MSTLFTSSTQNHVLFLVEQRRNRFIKRLYSVGNGRCRMNWDFDEFSESLAL